MNIFQNKNKESCVRTVRMPATRLAISSSDWRLRSSTGESVASDAVAVSRAAVSSLMRGVTVASVAVPLETSEAVEWICERKLN